VRKRGISAPFVDPSLTALEAHHIWMLPDSQKVLSVIAERTNPRDSRAVVVTKLRGLEHILIDAKGHQHVLLRASGRVLQLEIVGADILSEQVALTISPRRIDWLGRAASQMNDMHRILSGAPIPAQTWTARALNRRDSFIVFDCMMAGSTEREAGAVIYGAAAVGQDWRQGSLRQRVRRDRQRAEQFILEGYREFLR
jgi:hypothetical protein